MDFLKKVHHALVIPGNEELGYSTTRWINYDTAPLPPGRRTWNTINYLAFWGVAQLSISNWQASAGLLGLGFNIGEAMGAIIIAKVLLTILSLAQGWIGAEWHIGYTISQRLTLGMYGAYVGIVIRIVLSIVWYGAQAWLGGLCVTAMLSSWSYSFFTMRNTFPESAMMTTRDFIGYLLFHIISVPFMFIRPENSRRWVASANVISFLTLMSICIWATSVGGTGPLVHQPSNFVLMSRGWAWLYAISSNVGGVATGVLNMSDYTRFARKQGVQVLGTIFALQILGTIIPVFAVLTGSATINIWNGQPEWNPLAIIIRWMVVDYSPGARAAAFFAGLGLVVSQLATNIYGNGYAGGIDMSGLFPTYINIRRGCLLTALLSWAVQPWLFFNTSSIFLATMSSFTVFIVPLVGVMVTDYFWVRKQRIELSHLYTSSPEGAYWFWHGFNWRGILVWVVCFAPSLPGMISTINPSIDVGQGAMNYYRGNYIFSFFASVLFYMALNRFFPPARLALQDETDVYGTFTTEQAEKKGMAPFQPQDMAVVREEDKENDSEMAALEKSTEEKVREVTGTGGSKTSSTV